METPEISIDDDITGRKQLVRNVVVNYLGYTVFVVFGFIIPRAIDNSVGQAGLGVWDLCWSFVNYLNLSMMGIGSSVNRFVARYRAANDVLALRRVISTVVGIQLPISVFVLMASYLLAIVVPDIFAERLGDDSEAAGWVVGLLGASLATQIAFDVWRGVLSGCHRWDYYNALNASGYAATALIMLLALYNGGGLVSIAWVYLLMTIATEIARLFLARKVCPEISLQRSLINMEDAKKVTKFGLKSISLGLPDLLIVQSVNIFIVASLGPAALAIIARPLALVRHIATFASKFSNVLTPTAGSLQSQNRGEELREFALQSARNGWLISIPPLAFIIVLSDLVMELWMGPEYADWGTAAILAAGFFLPISQHPLTKVMVGLDEHGKIARTSIIVSTVVFGVGLVWVSSSQWTLWAAAALMAAPIGLGTGLAVLFHGLRYLSIDVRTYFGVVLKRPLILLLNLVVALLLVRVLSPYSVGMNLIIGAVATAAIAMVILRREIYTIYISIKNDQAHPN
jgi:O-antigen/teichoic acid export membrane protein